MVGHGGNSAGSYLADPTSPIPSHCASIVVTSTLRVNTAVNCKIVWPVDLNVQISQLAHSGIVASFIVIVLYLQDKAKVPFLPTPGYY